MTKRAATAIGLIIVLCLLGLMATSAEAVGVIGAPAFAGASADGSRIFFKTMKPLVPADTDATYDIYERFRGRTSLVSAGQINANGDFDVDFDGASRNGRRVFFRTAEQLVPADTDHSSDIYERFRGRTTLVSSGRINGNGAYDARFNHVSADGGKVLFTTAEQLVPADTNCCNNLYQHWGGRTSLVGSGSGDGFLTGFAGASADGGVVLFGTDEALVPADTDSSTDLYRQASGRTTLVSRGQINGNGEVGAYFVGASANASRVFFSTDERLVPADSDDSADIYQRFRGRTTLVSAGRINASGDFDATFDGASGGGRRVFFSTDEKLVAADTDAAADIYQRSGGRTKLVSIGQINGNGDFAPTFFRASANGSRVLFETTERLVRADTDSSYDVYQRAFGTTTLVSTGRINGNADQEAFADAASTDGSRVFFRSAEPTGPGRHRLRAGRVRALPRPHDSDHSGVDARLFISVLLRRRDPGRCEGLLRHRSVAGPRRH